MFAVVVYYYYVFFGFCSGTAGGGRRVALAALYLTLGSLMAGNRILMDFVISSTTTKTLPFLWVRTRSVFIFILSFALLLAYFSAVYLENREFCAIDIFLAEVFHKVDGLIKLPA